MKLKAKNSIKVAGALVRSGQEFDIGNADEAKRLIELGVAEQIMVPADESKIDEPAQAEEKPAAAANGRPSLTRR